MHWLMSGIFALLFYGLFGISNKYTSMTDNYAGNFVIQAAFIIGVTVIFLVSRKKLRWSLDSLLAGLVGGGGTWIVLAALSQNQLILVYPFVALSGLVFLAANIVLCKARYAGRKLLWLAFGLLVSCTGLFFAAVGGSGGLQMFISTFKLNFLFVTQGVGVMLCWGMLVFFWMRARVIKKHNEYTALLWSGVGSIAIALLMLVLHPSSIPQLELQLAPVLGGLGLVGGSLFILRAFSRTQTASSIKNLILAILTNGEIIPVTFYALIVLGEFSFEGVLGATASIAGIALLNIADVVKE